MKKIVLITIAIMTIACTKTEAPEYSVTIGAINPPEWMQGDWVSTDGNTNLGLVVSADNIIKDGVNQKEVMQGQRIIFEDVFKYSQDQYIYTYELKQSFEVSTKYTITTTTTIYNEDGKIAKDSKGNDRVKVEKKDYNPLHSAKFFKSHYTKRGSNVNFRAFLVNGALSEQGNIVYKNGTTKRETDITENKVKLKQVVVEETTDFTFEKLQGITEQDFLNLIIPRTYKKK